GRLKQERWQDREGKAQSRVIIVAEYAEFRPDFSGQTEAAADKEAETEESEVNEEAFVPTF
ncbi:MAG: single-stranded DNA-binding protein, partial [Treponema sp.]|nr:single-stranded DNA-binding protein [Treponema sp.]